MAENRIPSSMCIVGFLHCRKCLEELPVGVSPREWAQLDMGWTRHGFQVWCRRHNSNVVNIDFEDQKHPANLWPVLPDEELDFDQMIADLRAATSEADDGPDAEGG